MKRDYAFRARVLQSPSDRIELEAPNPVNLNDVLSPKLADFGNSSPGVGADPRHPAPDRLAGLGCSGQNLGGLVVIEAASAFPCPLPHVNHDPLGWICCKVTVVHSPSK